MAIVDTIESIKTNLASAYDMAESKGATIPVNRNMENLPPTIASISTGGGGTSDYVRPSDWLPIPAMDSTKDEIYILNGVGVKDYNIISFQLSGTGTIDWGDGTSEAVSGSDVTYTHIYNYQDIPANTWTEHNKTRQVLIHISGNRGEITSFNGAVNYYKNVDGNNVQMYNSASNLVYDITANVESTYVTLHNVSYSHYHNLEIFDWKGARFYTDMSGMFNACYSLQTIPQLDTSNVTNMQNMLSYCYSLQTIPQLDTSKVTSMSSMFYQCYSLQTIPQLDTSKVTSMSSMFNQCSSLQTIPQLNTSKVTNMSGMFSYCYSLQTIPQLNTSKVTNMSSMFYQCSSLQTIPQLNTSKVTNMSGMFSGCHSLQTIPQLNTSKVTNMQTMFTSCYSLQTILQLDTSNVTNMQNMLSYCYSLQTIPQLDTSNVTNMQNMFSGNGILHSVKLFNLNSNYTSAITLSNFSNLTLLSKQGLVDLFNSVAVNANAYSRTIQLGNTLQGYLANVYVKDSGEVYTAILPTSDTEVDPNKTYYTYDEKTDTYTQVVPDFTSNTFYYELKTATWNRYDICESTEAGAMLALDFARNVKGYTIT